MGCTCGGGSTKVFAGNIEGLAQHIMDKYGADHPFGACMDAPELANYDDATRQQICGRVKAIAGHAETFVIRHEGSQWVLYDHTGSKVLGRHSSEADALAQERAIQAAKHAHAEMDVEVFATGHWGGMPWTEHDLDQMVANFGKLSNAIKPPVKLGHDDTQILGGQIDGQPALGWIGGLKRTGSKLIATITGIPAVLKDIIDRGAYRRVSAEIYPTFEETNAEKNLKTGVTGRVLSSVAFLGADIPEVKTLEDLGKLLAKESAGKSILLRSDPATAGAVCVGFECYPEWRPAAHPPTLLIREGNDPPPGGDMTEAEIRKLIEDAQKATAETLAKQFDEQRKADKAAAEKQVADLKAAHDAEIKRLTEENQRAQAREAAAAVRAEDAAADRFVEQRATTDNFRLTPAQQPIARRLHRELGTLTIKAAEAKELKLFKEGEAERDMTMREVFERFVDAYPHRSDLTGEAGHADHDETVQNQEDSAKLLAAMNDKAKALYSKGFDVLTYDEKKNVAREVFKDPKMKHLAPKYGRTA